MESPVKERCGHAPHGPAPHGHLTPLDGVDSASAAVFHAYMRTLHLHRAGMMRTLEEHGGRFGQSACLRGLAQHDGLSQRDLAESLHISAPTVTAMLSAMERDELIERRADEQDRRVTRVFLSPKGRQLEAAQRERFAGYINRTVGTLDPSDRAELARLLRMLGDAIERDMGASAAGGDES